MKIPVQAKPQHKKGKIQKNKIKYIAKLQEGQRNDSLKISKGVNGRMSRLEFS